MPLAVSVALAKGEARTHRERVVMIDARTRMWRLVKKR